MFLTGLSGLCLDEVPTALVQKAWRSVQDSQIQAGQVSLGCWQPNILTCSWYLVREEEDCYRPRSQSPFRLLADCPLGGP